VEIKNTTYFDGTKVLFPDSVTERGQKHLRELAKMVQEGHRAVIYFLVNRPEGKSFAPADLIDPVYGKLLREVQKAGVEVLAYRASHSLTGIQLGSKVSLDF
jgi:sugar fermentation stimulation protein A